MTDAMRAKDAERLGAIRLLLSAVKQTEIDKRTHGEHVELDDAGVLMVIEKLIKQRRESIEHFRVGNRPDLIAKEEAEIKVLATYLPEQLTDAEVEELICKAISDSAATSMKDMGKVMGILKTSLQGRADIMRTSSRVKAILSSN